MQSGSAYQWVACKEYRGCASTCMNSSEAMLVDIGSMCLCKVVHSSQGMLHAQGTAQRSRHAACPSAHKRWCRTCKLCLRPLTAASC